jgi:excisionase family DNA binding protein
MKPVDLRELPLLLNAAEVAEILRTSRGAIYVMAERGQLPGVTRIGRRILVRSDQLIDWLNQKRAPSPQEER